MEGPVQGPYKGVRRRPGPLSAPGYLKLEHTDGYLLLESGNRLVLENRFAMRFAPSSGLKRFDDLDGIEPSPLGIISFWIRFMGENHERQAIYTSHGLIVQRHQGLLNISAYDSHGDRVLRLKSDVELRRDSRFHHVMATWHLGRDDVMRLYVDDIEQTGSLYWEAATIDYPSPSGHYIGQFEHHSFEGCLAEFYFNPGESLDLMREDQRRKFLTADGKPADLGQNGELPTGRRPAVFFKFFDFDGVNSGTGGDFEAAGLQGADTPLQLTRV